MPRFSVIIPAYNAAATLPALLASLQAQTSERDFETIVVDDASADATASIAERFGVRVERLSANAGPAAARNRGAELAAGEWLVFTDADTEFFPDTLDRLESVIASSDADAVVGSYAGRPANGGFVPRYKALWEYFIIDRCARLDARGLMPVSTWAPRPGAVRREAFQTVRGFDTTFRGADLEDMELGYRLADHGFRTYFAPAVRARHHYPESAVRELRAFARRCVLWTRMFVRRRKLESIGEGTPAQALADMAGFAAFAASVAGLAYPPALVGAAAAAGVFLGMNMRFLALAVARESMFFALGALAYRWLHTVILGFAAAFGMLTAHRGKHIHG